MSEWARFQKNNDLKEGKQYGQYLYTCAELVTARDNITMAGARRKIKGQRRVLLAASVSKGPGFTPTRRTTVARPREAGHLLYKN